MGRQPPPESEVELPKGVENQSGPSPVASTGDDSALDLSGRTLADFHILRKLGQGGMGQVYLAEQLSLKRKVALKILRPELAASPKALERFRREAEVVARATHANIVQVYAFLEAEGIHFMALEYVEGRNLKDYIARKGPPDLLVSLTIMRQVASALQRASELGIIHRDIKPENILLTRKSEVKVADFGLTRLEGDQPALNLTQTGVTMGTPLYMSPEQVEGKPVDSRTDIYSFGVTCYHMLTGQPPFLGASAFEVALQHVQKQPRPLQEVRPDLPDALCAIIHKMMAKDPAQRYQTGKDLLRDVVRLREGLSGMTAAIGNPTISVEPISAPPPLQQTAIEPVPVTPPSRRAWVAAAMAGTLFLAAGAGAALAWRERQREGPMPDAQIVKPADASVVETILLPNKREQALRVLVEQALNPPQGKTPDATGFTNCLELGLFYLDNDRRAEADKLFTRLETFKQPTSFQMLGQVGRAIVLALESKAQESNNLLCVVFAAKKPALVGPPLREKKGKGAEAIAPAAAKWLDQHLAPIKPMLDHPRGQYWLTRARWYNARNGVSKDQVPRYLLWRFPLISEGKTTQPRTK